jgi:RimJ/RimL family protein N-acetyltransferase
MELRPLTAGDADVYERIYTEPVMWAELGGVREQDMAEKLERDVRLVEEDRHWVLVIVTDEGEPAGTVAVWDHEWNGETIDEIGWMVLPEFQGRGLASWAVGAALERARAEDRWPVLHAFPGVTNGPSNAICRKAGFTLVEAIAYEFRGNVLHTNHWVLDRRAEEQAAARAPTRQ